MKVLTSVSDMDDIIWLRLLARETWLLWSNLLGKIQLFLKDNIKHTSVETSSNVASFHGHADFISSILQFPKSTICHLSEASCIGNTATAIKLLVETPLTVVSCILTWTYQFWKVFSQPETRICWSYKCQRLNRWSLLLFTWSSSMVFNCLLPRNIFKRIAMVPFNVFLWCCGFISPAFRLVFDNRVVPNW